MSEPTKAVFLSYASQDAEAARRICDSLRSGGVEVWFDADGGLEHGDEWDQKIRRQIKECVFFVPLISANTQARLEGYFRIEWELAAERAMGIAAGVPFILPIVIDDTREPAALVPDRFRRVQWTKIPDGSVPADVQARLLKLWSHRVGVLAHDEGRTRGPVYAPPVSSPMAPGETRAPGLGDPAEGATAFGGRRLAAIVFTDVVGYSARMQTDEASTLALVQADFEAMRRLCAQYGGQTLKSTGDGLLLCFDSVVDAASCALAIQAGFAGRGGGALQHRIGIHLGDVYHQAGDVTGDGVNLAARLQTAARPGAICVSDAVFAAVKGKVPMESVALAPLVLKNIAQPQSAYLIAPVGTRLAAGAGARGARSRRGWAFAAGGVALLAVIAVLFLRRPGKPAASPATPVASSAAPAAEFPRQPDLKRARALIFAVDSIAGDFALADDLVKPLLAAQPNDPEVVTVAAEVSAEYLIRGFDNTPRRRAQAQQLAERAVQLAPDNPAALAALGRYLRSDNSRTQLGRAEELLRHAIALDQTEPRYYRYLYSVLILTKPGPETEAFGAHMAGLFPQDPLVTYEIAVLHMSAGDLAAAEDGFDRTLELAPVPNAITAKAKIMLEVHGDVPGMKLWLDRMPERQRTNARLANAYAVQALVSGQTESARRVLDSITDTWLADGTYIFPRAMLLGDLDAIDRKDDVARLSYEAALDEINRALAADPTDLRPIRAKLWVQLALGHREEALAALRVNLQRRPNPYRWNINLTWWTSSLRACLLLGERAEAMTQLREACAEAQGRLLLRNLFHVDPKMAPFRDDPEIVALLSEPAAKSSALTSNVADAKPAAAEKSAMADKSVAVLAFANLSDDKNNEYFSDGISEELLTVLQKIPGLRVAARTSAWSFKGKSATAQEIGEKLGVAHLVEGSVQKIGNRVKISARLSRVATGEELWSESFPPQELTDAFAAESEIAQAIVAQLRGQLTGEAAAAAKAEIQAQVQAAEKGGTRNVEAHELYLQGKYFVNQQTTESAIRAAGLLRRAVELDPQFALAWAELSGAGRIRGGFGETKQDFEEGFKLAREASDRAMALAPDLAAVQVARANLLIGYDFDWKGAAESLQRARTLAPSDPAVLAQTAQLAYAFGQTERAVDLSREAVALDPVNPILRMGFGYALTDLGRYDEARAEYQRIIELSPSAPWGHAGVSMVLTAQGKADEAVAEAAKEAMGWSRLYSLAIAEWARGNKRASDAALAELIKSASDVAAVQIAWAYAFRHENDRAFEWLERAYRQHDGGLAWTKANFALVSLHPDPRWPAFWKKIGMTDELLK